MLHWLLRPKILIPVLLSGAILAGLLALSNLAMVIAVIEGLQAVYLFYFLVLMAAYEAVRCVQWRLLLTALDIRVPLRSQVFAFLGSEVTKSMPLGNYFQNYLLQQARGTDFGLSSAATTLIMLTEVAVSLVGVVILGLGTWSDWLRPVIGIGLGVFLLLGWAVHSLPHPSAAPAWVLAHASIRRVKEEWRQFRTGAVALVQVRLLVLQALLSVLYLSIAGTGLYVVVRGLGIDTVTLWQVLAVYLFSLAAALISPLPLDLGVIEVSGVGAFLAIGVSVSDAVGIMVLNRVLSLGAAIILALVAIVFLPDEFRAAFQERSRPSTIASERAGR